MTGRATDAARSCASLLAEAAEALRAAGVPEPQKDARWLLREATGLGAAALSAVMREAPTDEARRRFAALIAERVRRRPVSHLIGRRAFYGRSFRIDARALDPRPESETLVAAALAHLPEAEPRRVLDLGVGSGCLLLSVLAERPLATGLGVDRSDAALSLAGENAALLDEESAPAAPVAPRLRLLPGDWLEGLDERFDAVLCNPPYIPLEDWRALEPEVREHEPQAALTPGADGLAVYRALAPRIEPRLAPGGAAFFEVGRGQAGDVAALFEAAGLAAEPLRDLGGVERVVAIRRRSDAAGRS